MGLVHAATVTAVALLIQVVAIECQDEILADEFTVPNPFRVSMGSTGGHYFIKSSQTLYSKFEQRKPWDVWEYFSLETGISFSIHRERTHADSTKPEPSEDSKPSSEVAGWTIITDSQQGKSYIVRATDGTNNCELDHVHNGRHIFPWVYEYELDSKNEQQDATRMPDGAGRPRKKRPRDFLAAIYGVGGIWLNAIALKTKSKQIESHSPFKDSNFWQILAGDQLEMEMRFTKLTDQAASEIVSQASLDRSSRLKSVIVMRNNASKDPRGRRRAIEQECIIVTEFAADIRRENNHQLDNLYKQLKFCRETTKLHRVFPHLMHDLTRSAQRLYDVNYISRKYPMWSDGRHAGEFDIARHRYLYPIELVRELFSMAKETQVEVFEPLPFKATGLGYGRADIFIKKFTEAISTASLSNDHVTVYYHMIENERSHIELCKIGEREPAPKNELFRRQVHFFRPELPPGGQKFTAQLTGLGALLMNVAEIPYKTFSMQTRRIRVNRNPFDLKEFVELVVDEWKVVDKSTGWLMQFYFESSPNNRGQAAKQSFLTKSRGDITRLVRVDIRNPMSADISDSLVADAGENLGQDYDLLARFDVLELKFEIAFNSQGLDFLTTPVADCVPSSDDMNEQDELDSSEANQFQWDSSDDEDYGGLDGSSNEPNEPSKIKQNEVELMEDGELAEDYPMPDLFDLLESASAYKISSRILLSQDEDEHDNRESGSHYVYLVEQVDLEQEVARLDIFESQQAFEENRPDESAYISYSNELVLNVRNGICNQANDVTTPNAWLRFFSTLYTYQVIPPIKGRQKNDQLALNEALEESSEIPLFGIGALWQHALESELTEYVGHLKELLVDERANQQFKQRLWVDRSFGMNVVFNFLYQLVDNESTHPTGKPPVRLHYIVLNNFLNYLFQDDGLVEGTKFRKIKIQVLNVSPLEPRLRLWPSECYEGQDAFKVKEREEVNVEMPSFLDSIEHHNIYQARYWLKHEILEQSKPELSQPLTETVRLVDEDFNISENQGRIIVSGAEFRNETYIDGSKQQMLTYLKPEGRCILDERLHLFGDLKPLLIWENNDFESGKFYGLAALMRELSFYKTNLRIVKHASPSGSSFQTNLYGVHLETAGDHGETLTREVKVTFCQLVSSDHDSRHSNDQSTMDDHERVRLKRNTIRLESIQFEPIKSNGVISGTNGDNYAIRIEVIQLVPREHGESQLSLPSACVQMLEKLVNEKPDAPPPPPPTTTPLPKLAKGSEEFPRLSKQIIRLNHYHMKSELTLRRADDPGNTMDNNNLIILDEWVHNSMVRMQAHAISVEPEKFELDFLLYMDTREVFDLSKRYNCRSEFPSPAGFQIPVDSPTNAMDFWCQGYRSKSIDEGDRELQLINHPAHLYYGPLALWLLAERNLANVELIATTYAPSDLPSGLHSSDAAFEQELHSETWRIRGSQGAFDWVYDMRFRYHRPMDWPGEQLGAHYSLEMIEFQNKASDGSGFSKILIQVAYAKHRDATLPTMGHFILPVGWGCMRIASQPDGNMWDDFLGSQMTTKSVGMPNILAYQATLDIYQIQQATSSANNDVLFEDPEDQANRDESNDSDNINELNQLQASRLSSPYLSGGILRSGANLEPDFKLNVYIHKARVHYANGTTQATRTVVDEFSSMAYKIDLSTGQCNHTYNKQANCTVLDFQMTDEQLERVYLNDKLMDLLFMNTIANGYTMLQRFAYLDGTVITRYERKFAHLFITKNLRGPASVVRQFVHHKHEPLRVDFSGQSRPTRLHPSIQVKVFIYGQGRENLRGLLRILLRQEPPVPLSGLISRINLFQCFNLENSPSSIYVDSTSRQLASYTAEYQLDKYNRAVARLEMGKLRDNFYKSLIKQTNLSPLQLDGNLRCQFSKDKMELSIHFNILDAPPVHLYFRHKLGSIMNNDLMGAAELKLVGHLEACAQWCAELDCVALSYCQDNRCYAINERLIRRNFNGKLNDLGELRQFLAQASQEQTGCSYHYLNQENRPMSLKAFAVFAERQVNSLIGKPDKRNPLAISLIADNFIDPIRFYESVSGNKFYWTREDHEKPINLVEQETKDFVYAVVREFHSLEVAKLNDGFKFKLITTNKLVNCLRACETDQCLLMSYCKKLEQCSLVRLDPKQQVITANPAKSLLNTKTLLDRLAKPNEFCSIFMQDFRPKFRKLHYTQVPTEFLAKFEGYSPMECALLSQLANTNSLSFVQCTESTSETKFLGEDDASRVQVCFLQQGHLELDTYKQSMFAYCPRATYQGKAVNCDHYSKLPLINYEQIKNRKLKQRLDTTIRGFNAERCALDCLRDDQCWAFEYCYSNNHQPAQSCLFLRFGIVSDLINLDDSADEPRGQMGDGDALDLQEQFKKLTKYSQTCSIFLERGSSFKQRLEQVSQMNQSFTNRLLASSQMFLQSRYGKMSLFSIYLFGSILVGLLLQVAHIRLVGRPFGCWW